MRSIRALLFLLICTVAATVTASSAAAHPVIKGSTSMSVRLNKEGHKVDLANSPLFKQALVEFGNKRYGPAEQLFENLDKHGYCCDMVHYYMAQCYDNLNQTEAAQMNYQWVAAYSKDATLVNYSIYGYEKLAYYDEHRNYAGQGNNFDRVKSRPVRSPVRSRVPPPTSYRFG